MDLANRALDSKADSRFILRWPVRMLGPAPGLKEINLVCWGLWTGLAAIPLSVPIWIGFKSGTGIAGILPIDFIYFYGIGRLHNEYSFAGLYNYTLQLKIFNEIFPVHDGAYGPSPYPPLVALAFSLFARLPFSLAYLAWMATSLILYLIGIAAATKAARLKVPLEISLIFCFALAYHPFLVSTLANGQLATVAAFSIGLAVLFEMDGYPILSGLALSVLAYKPTLLILILPMLLLTRRFRALFGFAAGVTAFILATAAIAGVGIWPEYLHFLRYFGQAAGVNGQSVLLRWKYVDLSSLSYGIFGGRSIPGLAILAAVACAIASSLAVLLWKSAKRGKAAQALAWATTLTWTLLLNVYVPIYDSVLVVVAAILTLGALKELGWDTAKGWFILLSVATIAISWITMTVARSHGIQLLTILIFALGMAQLILLRRTDRQAIPSSSY